MPYHARAALTFAVLTKHSRSRVSINHILFVGSLIDEFYEKGATKKHMETKRRECDELQLAGIGEEYGTKPD